MYISHNSIEYHAEISASQHFYSISRKNPRINMTVIRLRLNCGIWEYCLSAPCKHCSKSLSNFECHLKKVHGRHTNINVRWSLTSSTLELTPYYNVNNQIVKKTAKISSGNAKKLNKWNQYAPMRT